MKTARTILSTLTLPAALIALAAAPAVAGPQLKVKVLTPTPTLTRVLNYRAARTQCLT